MNVPRVACLRMQTNQTVGGDAHLKMGRLGIPCLVGRIDGRRLACAAYIGSSSLCVIPDGVLSCAVDYKALRRSSGSSAEEVRQELFDELYKLKLTSNGTNKGKNVAVVKGISFLHDSIIKAVHSHEFEEHVRECLFEKFQMQWYPGGHATAAALRSVLHSRLVIETVQELLEVE